MILPLIVTAATARTPLCTRADLVVCLTALAPNDPILKNMTVSTTGTAASKVVHFYRLEDGQKINLTLTKGKVTKVWASYPLVRVAPSKQNACRRFAHSLLADKWPIYHKFYLGAFLNARDGLTFYYCSRDAAENLVHKFVIWKSGKVELISTCFPISGEPRS